MYNWKSVKKSLKKQKCEINKQKWLPRIVNA